MHGYTATAVNLEIFPITPLKQKVTLLIFEGCVHHYKNLPGYSLAHILKTRWLPQALLMYGTF